MSREEWPARVFHGAQEDRPGKGGRKASLSQGTLGLVGWFSGYHHHRGRSSLFPLPPAPHLLPEPLYHVSRWGQSEKGNSQQPTWVKVCCVLKLGAKVRCAGLSVSLNDPGFIVISLSCLVAGS